MNDQDPTSLLSRRQLLGFGTGLAAAAVLPTFSRAAEPAGPTGVPLQDPLTKYPRPPFKVQLQEWPGLASKMEPPPDHGETSYRGSGRLMGRKALITGGDSGMGRAAAIAYAREGADVAINYFPTEESDAREVVALIKAAGRKAVAIPGDLREEAFCQRLVAEAVQGLGGLDIVVSNAGRQQSHASILDISTEQFDWTMKTNIYAPFWIIKAALPHLPPGSAIIGTTSEQAYDPSADLYDYAQTKAATMNYVKVAGQAAGAEGNSGQWRRSRTNLDPFASQRRRLAGKAQEVWGSDLAGPAGAARGISLHLCSAGGQRRELCDRQHLWLGRRHWRALKRRRLQLPEILFSRGSGPIQAAGAR